MADKKICSLCEYFSAYTSAGSMEGICLKKFQKDRRGRQTNEPLPVRYNTDASKCPFFEPMKTEVVTDGYQYGYHPGLRVYGEVEDKPAVDMEKKSGWVGYADTKEAPSVGSGRETVEADAEALKGMWVGKERSHDGAAAGAYGEVLSEEEKRKKETKEGKK